MKVSHKILIGSVLVLGIGVGGYVLYSVRKKNLGTSARGGEETNEDIKDKVPTTEKFPLKRGDKGEEVKVLQQYLNRAPMCKRKMPQPSPTVRIRPLLPLDEDGIFGEKTEAALQMCYETLNVDESLWNRMKKALPTMSINE